MVAARGDKVTVFTLGPEGTCHERAVQRYLAFQGVDEYRIELIGIPSSELFGEAAHRFAVGALDEGAG
jgi:hypothetical protein